MQQLVGHDRQWKVVIARDLERALVAERRAFEQRTPRRRKTYKFFNGS
jgi:hypothetical protein